ncbi:MAG: sulfatase-like hydrolase/transferase [Planctomycetota bacterium]|jgi:glucan phosphoethanolaminetransferase (alkaline phosphatase superfamily)|nr:sulfatase-like hydrolase/transferase [Planctomycetota bacterium]
MREKTARNPYLIRDLFTLAICALAVCIICLLVDLLFLELRVTAQAVSDIVVALPAFFALCYGCVRIWGSGNKFAAALTVAVFVISLGVQLGFVLIQHRPLLPHDMGLLIDGIGMIRYIPMNIIRFFLKPIVISVIGMAVLSFLFWKIRHVFLAFHSSRLPILTPAALFAFGVIYYLLPNNAWHLINCPIILRIPLMTTSWFIRDNFVYRGPRDKPENLEIIKEPAARHIIFIVDESVGGKYLGINGYPSNTTPFLESMQGEFFNYGQCCSAANLSQNSNLVLVSGLTKNQLPDRNQAVMRQPSIFAYAKKAGFQTYYLDVQGYSRGNSIYPRDFADFTMQKIQAKHFFDRDIQSVVHLRNLIDQSEEPTFTYVLKAGIHYGYENKIPPAYYPDALPERGHVPELYHRAIRWTVDEFFTSLERAMRGKDVLVVYTSDHGQNFLGDGSAPHGAGQNAPIDQANVPLIIWPFSEKVRQAFEGCGGYVPEMRDRAWHFQFFPTLLQLFGYRSDDVVKRYGDGLFQKPPEKRFFVSGKLFDEFGKDYWETYLNDFRLN